MEILLINPPNPKTEKGPILPPLSLIYLSAYLKKHGYSPEILDLDAMKAVGGDIDKIVKGEKPDIIGVTGYTHTRFQAYEIIRKIKQIFPESLLVVGGHHFTYLAEEAMANIPEIDCVVRGEGEITFLELIRARETGQPFGNISGITFRENSQIISNPDRPFYNNVEDFNISVNDLPKGNFEFLTPFRRGKGGKAMLVMTGRGCPNRCVFCVQGSKSRRFIPVEKIIEDIKIKTAHFKTQYVHFYDPSLTLDEQYIKDLCQAIIENKLNIKWYCESRVNINLDILKLMKKAGCVSVDFGLESGSPKILKNIKKGIIIEQVLPFAKTCYDLGIHTHVFIMISLPGETTEDSQMTLKILEDLVPYIDSYSLGVLTLYPGTEIYESCRLNNRLPFGFSWFKPWQDQRNVYLDIDSSLPLYFEYFSPDDIKDFFEKVDRLWLTKKRTFPQVVKKHLLKTIFDWESENLYWKIKKLGRLIKMIKYRLS